MLELPRGAARRPTLVALRAIAPLALAVAASAQSAAPVAFNRDIRPLLSDRCFQCHGTDAQARKANLRLDTWEGLTSIPEGSEAAAPPVVPGDPEGSTLIARIHAPAARGAMPPPDSGLTLDDAERALLRRWIEEGAVFEEHWAFVPPAAVAPPAVAVPGIEEPSAIDRFVQARLEAEGLEAADRADPATLIRRLGLDLTGLPPTPEEVAAFVADPSEAHWRAQVDRMLDSERFGERMASVWLDLARYADTNGFHHDNVRTAWPYRDWVIEAFRTNMPYDRFVTEQLAGDLLEGPGGADPTVQQRIATAYCRMHNINDEGGALDPEYRVEAVCDRIETIATSLMGLTFTCARCHDHKYDPFTQQDYFSLYAIFDSVEERGVYPANFEQARAYPARLDYRSPELEARIHAAEADVAAARRALADLEPEVARERAAWETRYRQRAGVAWAEAALVAARSTSGASLEALDDGSFRSTSTAERDTHVLTFRTDRQDLNLLRLDLLPDPSSQDRVGRAPNGNAVITGVEVVARSLEDPTVSQTARWSWAWASHEQPNGDFDVLNLVQGTGEGWALQGHDGEGPRARTALLLCEAPVGFAGGTEFEVRIACESRYARHVVARPRVAFGRMEDRAALPTTASDWWTQGPVRGAFDALFDEVQGPERAVAADLGADKGWKHTPALRDGAVYPLKGERAAFYAARIYRTPVARSLTLSLGSDDGLAVYHDGRRVLEDRAHRGVAPDQARVTLDLHPGENLVVLEVVNDAGAAGVYARTEPEDDAIAALEPLALLAPDSLPADLGEAYRLASGARRSPSFAAGRRELEARQAVLAATRAEEVPVLVMRELEEPVPTFVLARGQYDAADETRPVQRDVPAALGLPWPENAPRDRRGFAAWLTDPRHPLTARVHVNRLWKMLFGRGIVGTAENFGLQAEWPSHPQLLDWLAREFVASGWDQKALLRRIVCSETYRRAAVPQGDAASRDPDNRLLSWFPRRRLPAEALRDQALYVAGLLDETVGGPSVRPYQPEGLWREVSIGGSSNTQVFTQDSGSALYRRSLYTFWKRTSPNPQMATFDAPTREFCVVDRGVTNTPLQALVLWNDVQFVEAARHLAARALRRPGRDAERLGFLLTACTARAGDAREHRVLAGLLDDMRQKFAASPDDARALLAVGDSPRDPELDATEHAAWTAVASAVLNLDATVTRP